MNDYFMVYSCEHYDISNGKSFVNNVCDLDNNVNHEFKEIKYPIKESMITKSAKIKDGVYKHTFMRYKTNYDYFFIREDFLPKNFIIKDYYKREGGAGLMLLADIDEVNLKDVKFYLSISNIIDILKCSYDVRVDTPDLVINGDYKIIKKGRSLFLAAK